MQKQAGKANISKCDLYTLWVWRREAVKILIFSYSKTSPEYTIAYFYNKKLKVFKTEKNKGKFFKKFGELESPEGGQFPFAAP